MSAPDPECVVCGRLALWIPGRDGGFPAYRNFRAVWDEPKVFGASIHFVCLHTWEHRDAFLAELLSLATNQVEQYEVRLGDTVHQVSRTGLGFTDLEFEGDGCLVYRHRDATEWLVVDLGGGWQQLARHQVLDLARGVTPMVTGGTGRYALPLPERLASRGAKEPADVADLRLPELIQAFGLETYYPDLDPDRSELSVDALPAGGRKIEFAIRTPALVPAEATRHFAERYRHEGDSAFAPRPWMRDGEPDTDLP